jgi:hypothetical protein
VPPEFDFDDLEPLPAETLAQVDRHSQDLQAQLLYWNVRIGYLSFKKLPSVADLATYKIPLCSVCLYGKATKRAWRTAPLHIDWLRQRLQVLEAQCPPPTIFLTEETLQAKRAFNAYAKSTRVVVNHSHADYGRFIMPAFRNHFKDTSMITQSTQSRRHMGYIKGFPVSEGDTCCQSLREDPFVSSRQVQLRSTLTSRPYRVTSADPSPQISTICLFIANLVFVAHTRLP